MHEGTEGRLARGFFARTATTVAPELVGKLLVREDQGLVARIVEVEAYTQQDPACHAYRGKTPRNAPLFGPPGHAYVYFTYGMHWCLNTVTGEEGHGEGVLLRAAQPLGNLALMQARRGNSSERDLLRGPARLAQAFGIDGAVTSTDLCNGGSLYLADDGATPKVITTARTGVAQAADQQWRFVEADSRWASPYKRHPRASG